jgi:hypothetical protein
VSNSVGGDAEAIAEIGPEGDGVLLASLLQRQEGIAASSAILTAGAAADLAEGHRVADILLRTVGVERRLGALEGDQQFGFALLEAGEQLIELGKAGSARCRETPLTGPSISPSVPNAPLPFAELNLPALHGILPGISPEEERPCSIQTLLSASVW